MARTNTTPAPFRRCSGATNKPASHGDTSWFGSISDSTRRHVPIVSLSAFATSATPLLWSAANSSRALNSCSKDAFRTEKAMYAKGDGVTQDYAQALYWWRKAASSGFAESENSIGFSYHEGTGVAQD